MNLPAETNSVAEGARDAAHVLARHAATIFLGKWDGDFLGLRLLNLLINWDCEEQGSKVEISPKEAGLCCVLPPVIARQIHSPTIFPDLPAGLLPDPVPQDARS